MKKNNLLEQTKTNLENYMKVYPVILGIDGNAARKVKTELESRYNFQVRRLERQEADAKKTAEQEAIAELAAKKADETPEERIVRLESALQKMGIEI